MPAIGILKNGELLCRIGSAGLDVISVSVGADPAADAPASLDASGGSFDGCGCNEALIWEQAHALAAGDALALLFEAEGLSSREGCTVLELAAGGAVVNPLPEPGDAAAIAALEGRPLRHPALALLLTPPGGAAVTGRPDAARPLLSFSLLWQARRPEVARLYFRRRSLREAIAHDEGEMLLGSRLAPGGRVELAIAA
jgi:hypothetical protein